MGLALSDGSLLDDFLGLGEDELDVARVGHVGVDLVSLVRLLSYPSRDESTYTTVGTVSTSAALGSLVDLDALDDQVAGVETLAVSVGLGVLEEVGDEAGRLLGPAGLADTPVLTC